MNYKRNRKTGKLERWTQRDDLIMFAFILVALGILLLVMNIMQYVLQHGNPLWIFGAIMAIMVVAGWFIKDGEEQED